MKNSLLEERQEPSQRTTSYTFELDHRAWVFPVPEAQPIVIGRPSEIDHEAKDDKASIPKVNFPVTSQTTSEERTRRESRL